MITMTRSYDQVIERVSPAGARELRMQQVADALWEALRDTGVSWLGFYIHEGGDELILGPRHPKPACSPIGLHGACGRCFRGKVSVIVWDVRDLGENYIACDPRDQSEVVVPCLDADGTCWAVLDLDSHSVGSFNDEDVAGLTGVLRAAGLTT